MSLFRRRRDVPEGSEVLEDRPVEPEAGDDAARDLRQDGEGPAPDLDRSDLDRSDRSDPDRFDRSEGPWDSSEVADHPEPGPGEPPFIDLGAIRLRAQEGLELSLEVDDSRTKVTSVTAKLSGSAVQLQAFAAPRTAGIWAEIREGIVASVRQQGGSADEVPGVFGRELLTRVPVRGADGKPARQAVRFTGVDGPRWFLRAVFHGPAAYRPEAAARLEELVRSVVVERGNEAMAPRDLLPLRMPQVGDEPAAEEAAAPAGREPLRPFERGPEITEVR